jgi:predicted RNA binding protein YcfA (HicA-like mRNA interferase family)
VTYREAAVKLRRLGYEEVRRRGSHRRWVNPATGGRTTLPDCKARHNILGLHRFWWGSVERAGWESQVRAGDLCRSHARPRQAGSQT